MSSSNCCFLTCIQIWQETGQVVWYSHLFQNCPQFIVIHTVKGFGIVNKTEIWRRKWQPTPVFLPGESQWRGSLVGCRLWGRRVGHDWSDLAAAAAHASQVMLTILQARLQQYVNRELPDVQAGFRKGRGTRDQIASIRWIMEKATEFQKNIYFHFIDHAKAFWLCGSQ